MNARRSWKRWYILTLYCATGMAVFYSQGRPEREHLHRVYRSMALHPTHTILHPALAPAPSSSSGLRVFAVVSPAPAGPFPLAL